ncbi:MAG: DUF4389 domain-containing protein [Dehalococcoidia bacterium]|nr:DUF4389 domain-containing protein [Dehalococcoidia bacterium]
MENNQDNAYPVQFNVDYPEGSRNRLTALVRIILAIPILIVVALVSGYTSSGNLTVDQATSPLVVGGVVWSATILMLLFRRKYPRWWFDWNLELQRFSARVGACLGLLRDEYPSTDEEQSVHLDIPYPAAEKDLNRFLPLVKWLLAIPHYIVLIILGLIAFIITIIAWLAILVLGRYPKGMFDFVVGVSRWGYRVAAYAFLLSTDRYPPFRLD